MREGEAFPEDDWQKLREEVVELRRSLHSQPETSGDEARTAARIREALGNAGVELVAAGVGGHGLLFRVRGNGDRPIRLFRADLDALPLQEASDAPHASGTPARHHACGHDGHMAMLVGALRLLHGHRERVEGTVYGLFQPAEETGAGMAACLEHASLAELRVDHAFAIHNVPGYARGALVLPRGPAAVASTGLRICLRGVRAHASEPHLARNPILTFAEIVPLLLHAPTRLPFGRVGLATLVRLHAGEEGFGSSPDAGELDGVLRADVQEDLDAMVAYVRGQVAARAEAARLQHDFELVDTFPATTNASSACAAIETTAAAAGLRVVASSRPFPWSEDFGHATNRWKGALVGLGAGESHPPLHSASYDFPDDVLDAGVRLWYGLATTGAPP